MTSEPENLVLTYLRRMDGKLDRLVDDVRDLKLRMTGTEEGVAGIHRRLDRLEGRIERIGRRLDIVEA